MDKLRADKSKEDQEKGIDRDFEKWKKMLSYLSSDYKNRERFLRQYYNAFKVLDTIYVDKIPKATRSSVIRIYDALISKGPETFFKDIYDAAKIYSEHLLYDEIEDIDSAVRSKLKDLSNINGVDGYMLLLFVNKQYKISVDEKVELIDFLCKYFVRRSITDFPPTRDLTNLFMELIQLLYARGSYSFDLISTFLQDETRCSTHLKFEQSLSGKIYDENVNATRYVLTKIEEAFFTKENNRDFWSKNDKGKYIWTIEHVMPQAKNMKPYWVDMIADGDRARASDIQQEYLHKLGNLTLTGYNSTLSDKPLDYKQSKLDANGNPIGFNNGLRLNEQLSTAENWKETDIINRTVQLVSEALAVFKLSKDK